MILATINNVIDRMRGRTLAFFSSGNQLWRRAAVFFAVSFIFVYRSFYSMRIRTTAH